MKKIFKRMSALICCIFITGCAGDPPTDIGVKNGTLSKCPKSPNCVVSQDGDEKHRIKPITYRITKAEAVRKLKDIILSFERTKLISETDAYLYFEFESKIMGYVDDVEFYFPNEPVIHVRSASRVGYGDLGVNRKRIEHIRTVFNK